MTVDASIIDGITTTNSSSIVITDLDGAAAADLSGITGGTTSAISDGNVTFTGSLGSADLTITGNSTFTASGSANLGNGTITINSGSTLILNNTLGLGSATLVNNGNLSIDAADISGSTISGNTITVTNLEETLNADFTNITPTTLNVDWSGTGTYTGNLTNVDTLTVSSGTMEVLDTELLSVPVVSGNGSIEVDFENVEDATTSFSNVNINGTLTINDDTGNRNITGSSNNDILKLNSGNDTVNLGAGDDTVDVNITDLGLSDNITDTSGSDTLNITSSGTIDSDILVNQVNGFETLNMSTGNDTISFDDVTDLNNFRTEFTNIADAGGDDTLEFGTSTISGDLDFSGLNEFENLNLSSVGDTITLSGDEPSNIDGLGGDDNFTLDFSNIGSFTIDGGEATETNGDTIDISGNTGASVNLDTSLGNINAFDNIEALDFTSFDMNVGADASDGGTNAEFTLTSDLINAWTSGDNSLKLTLDADDASKLEFNDTTNGKIGGDDSDATAMTSSVYTLNDDGNTVTLDITIVP